MSHMSHASHAGDRVASGASSALSALARPRGREPYASLPLPVAVLGEPVASRSSSDALLPPGVVEPLIKPIACGRAREGAIAEGSIPASGCLRNRKESI